ncbi:TRIC cation channel family protein [Ectorhizobium quercum]|uniref:TRIC cation channel family protein n=1 Tax=Ectorhizobium quercum TaxID=2965071 RepID=UPI00352290EF
MSTLAILDHAGTAVFAVTGRLAASRGQLDPIGFLFLAAMTRIGGGTMCDLVPGQAAAGPQAERNET